MQIIALSDVHCAFEKFAPSRLPDADLCIVAGDFTHFGKANRSRFAAAEWEAAQQWMARLTEKYGRVLWIPGNHDIGVDVTDFPFPNVSCLTWVKTKVGGLTFCGVSCCPCYDAPQLATNWAYSTIDEAEEKTAFDLPPCDVVVSHCPPYGVLDNAGFVLGKGFVHIGSKALLAYIAQYQPALVICGHAHNQATWYERVGETLVVNVAQRCGRVTLAFDSGANRTGVDVEPEVILSAERWIQNLGRVW